MAQSYIASLDTDKREAVMRLYGAIGAEVNGHWFAKDLASLDRECDLIIIRVNSPGGDVIQGMSIISAIMSINTPVHIYVDGVAASQAAVITACADKIYMMDYAKMMIHDPHFGGRGALTAKEKKILSRFKDMLSKVLSRRGKAEDEVSALMAEETWFSAEEAREHNLCDEILPSAKNELFNLAPQEIIAQINAEYQSQTESSMKLTNEAYSALGVTASATDAEISTAIVAIQLALSTANQEKSALEARAVAAENKLAEIENQKAEAQKQEAKTLIDAAKRDGRINAADTSAVSAWEKSFTENHENAKILINALPKHTPVTPTIGNNTVASPDNELLNKSWDELFREDRLADLKNKFPEQYAAKFEQKYGKKPTV